jgi:hypothetical protein
MKKKRVFVMQLNVKYVCILVPLSGIWKLNDV